MKKFFTVTKNIFTIIVIIIAISMMIFTIISVKTLDRIDRDLFGYKAFIVMSDSMSETDFSAGDLVISKDVDPATLEAGDIITFTSQDADNFGEIVTHKIREKITTANGEAAFITYGTTTDTNDKTPVTYPYIIGQYKTSLSGVGKFFSFLKTTPGYVCCILIPFVLLIILQLFDFVKTFRIYKAEQMGSIEAERRKLAEEREQSQAMMQELLEMKAMLAKQVGSSSDDNSSDDGSGGVV